MRLMSIFSAILIALVLYAIIMDRDALLATAGVDTSTAAQISDKTHPEPAAISVLARHFSAENVRNDLILRGHTEAHRRVEMRAETTGQVMSPPLRRGARIRQGEVLCEIEPGTRMAQLERAKALYAEAEANARASESLVERGYTSETKAIGNRANLTAAQAEIDRAQLEIDNLRILAPFDGLLESDTAELGALLQPGSVCATIIALDPIKLIGFATENVVDEVRVGAQVGARLLNGRDLTGVVTFVSRSADPATRTFRVEAEVANPDHSIRDGVTTEIHVELQGTIAHVLPQSALTLNDAGRLGVRSVDGDMARFLPVHPIRDTSEGMIVTGLPRDIDIIVVGQDFVTDGQRIEARFEGTMQ